MKKHGTSLLLFGVVGVAIISLAQSTPNGKKPSADADVQALRSEVAELRSRVQTLDERTKNLASALEQLKQPHHMPLSPQGTAPLPFKSPSTDSESPKIWGEEEVNGWTVYIVPCQQKSH